MSAKNDGEPNGFNFRWEIKNISHCWLKKGERIESPSFKADVLERTQWKLWLYPMGDELKDCVSLYLYREKESRENNSIGINYQLAFLGEEGSILQERTSRGIFFSQDYYWSAGKNLESRKRVFVTEREVFIPDDTLRVQCTIWKKDQTLLRHLSARTIFKVNRTPFFWRIDELNTGVRSEFKDDLICFDLVVNKTYDLAKKLDLSIASFDERIKYFSLKISVMNSEGNGEECVAHEYFARDFITGPSCTLLFTKRFTENKLRYLPNRFLELSCEFTTSNGTCLDESSGCGIILPILTKMVVENRSKDSVEKKQHISSEEQQPNIQPTSVLANDLKSLYKGGIFSDMQLRTSTQTFQAHKTVLVARSPVFRKMLGSDMREKNSGQVEITDLEDDTVDRMLLYMYTDSLEDLEMKNGCKLYAAADKYEILSLRNRCSAFLGDNLCTKTACDVLALADRHRDEDLKSAALDFILRRDKEVFGSQEWKSFMATNIQLAADVMYRKVFPR